MDKNLLVAVKLGTRGAIEHHEGQQHRAEIVPVKVVDTTGAGDSFDAGYLYGRLNAFGTRTLRLACICGSLSTRAVGGTNAQATLEEALAYL
jgi:sugar/nucleoside kinase (ribokinase family)